MLGSSRRKDVCLYSARFEGTAAAVSHQLSRIRALPDLDTAINGRSDDMLIVLAEVLNNIVEHAFAKDGKGWIECQITQGDGRIMCITSDEGPPLPPSLLCKGSLPETASPVEDLPEGGFGWFIIHSLVDDMIYEREMGRNQLSFTFGPA